MKAKKLYVALACFSLTATSLLYAQEGQNRSQSATQTTTATANSQSSIDNQGIIKYLLGPGDSIDVRVFGQPDLNTTAEVDSDGNISLPFVEKPIAARCRNEKDLQKDITAAYSKYIKNPQVSVRIMGRNSRPPAIVHGAVNAPQRIQMQRKVRLNELLAVAGGVTERSNGVIQVLHTEPVMCPDADEQVDQVISADTSDIKLRIFKISDILAGKQESNPFIRPGDIVRAMEAEPVYIMGSVANPQGIYLRDQLTLSRAIAMVGGVRREANSKDIRIYRQKPGSQDQEVIKVDYAAIKNRKQQDVLLKPYDVIEVREASALSPDRILSTVLTGVVGGVQNAVGAIGGNLPLRIIY